LANVSQLMDQYRAGKMSSVSNEVERITRRKPRTVQQFIQETRTAFV